MQKILYFLLGFSLSCSLLLPYAKASECLDLTGMKAEIEAAIVGYDIRYYGHYGSYQEAQDAAEAGSQLNSSGWSSGRYDGINIRHRSQYVSGQTPIYHYASYSETDPVACADDSDGDGLPDECDIYPDDSTPYSVKLTSYQTTDGKSSSPHVRETYETDRGDTIAIGADWTSDSPDHLIFNGTWIDGADLCGSTGNYPMDENTDTGSGPSIDNPLGDSVTTVGGDGSAESTPDAGSSSGVAADGSESDADQKIIGNTKATADNTQILTAYMKDLNKKVSEHNALVASGQLTEQENREADQREAEQAEDNFNSVSVDDHFSGVSGTLTEGEDYTLPGEIADETFINDFFSSNPLITAFENSAFESSNSTPKATLVLAELGTHEIDLSPLEDGFKLAGDLLFALCSIGALILVVRG